MKFNPTRRWSIANAVAKTRAARTSTGSARTAYHRNALVRELLRRASAAGLGHEDFSVMGKLLRDPIRHSDVHRWLKRLSGELRSGKDS